MSTAPIEGLRTQAVGTGNRLIWGGPDVILESLSDGGDTSTTGVLRTETVSGTVSPVKYDPKKTIAVAKVTAYFSLA